MSEQEIIDCGYEKKVIKGEVHYYLQKIGDTTYLSVIMIASNWVLAVKKEHGKEWLHIGVVKTAKDLQDVTSAIKKIND